MDFKELQKQQAEWQKKNFDPQPPENMFLGVVEEVGELAHATLKYRQGIRGVTDEVIFQEKAKDAVGDIIIFLAGYCTAMDFDMQEIVESTFKGVVLNREWKKNPNVGVE